MYLVGLDDDTSDLVKIRVNSLFGGYNIGYTQLSSPSDLTLCGDGEEMITLEDLRRSGLVLQSPSRSDQTPSELLLYNLVEDTAIEVEGTVYSNGIWRTDGKVLSSLSGYHFLSANMVPLHDVPKLFIDPDLEECGLACHLIDGETLRIVSNYSNEINEGLEWLVRTLGQ